MYNVSDANIVYFNYSNKFLTYFNNKPTTSEVLSQKHFLLLVRVQPIFVCSIFHTTKIIIILETAKENSKKISDNSSTEDKDLGGFLADFI